MRTTNYTDLRNNLKGYFDKVVDDCEPLIVHRGDEESVVSISMEEYNAIKETEYIMRSQGWQTSSRRAKKRLS